MPTLFEKFKEHLVAASSVLAFAATIAGGIIYVNSNYASAKEVNTLLQKQESISAKQDQQIKLQISTQRQQSIFQLEYYDDKLKKLQEEKRIAEERVRTRSLSRAVQKTPDEIQDEINDMRKRRDIVRKSLEE